MGKGKVMRIPDDIAQAIENVYENTNKSKKECVRMIFQKNNEKIQNKAKLINQQIKNELEGWMNPSEIDDLVDSLQLPVLLKIYYSNDNKKEIVDIIDDKIGKAIYKAKYDKELEEE